jgi:hypothetical protein
MARSVALWLHDRGAGKHRRNRDKKPQKPHVHARAGITCGHSRGNDLSRGLGVGSIRKFGLSLRREAGDPDRKRSSACAKIPCRFLDRSCKGFTRPQGENRVYVPHEVLLSAAGVNQSSIADTLTWDHQQVRDCRGRRKRQQIAQVDNTLFIEQSGLHIRRLGAVDRSEYAESGTARLLQKENYWKPMK